MDDSDIFLDSVFINAVQKGDLEKVKKMIGDGISKSEKKIALNNRDSDGMVALAYALKNDNSNMFHLLLEGGANINIPPWNRVLKGSSRVERLGMSGWSISSNTLKYSYLISYLSTY